MDASAMARLLDEIRGGNQSHEAEQRAAKAALAFWPRLPDVIRRYDRFRSAVAEDAVRRGVTAVVFGAAGFPVGEPPHLAAAGASPSARFFYPQGNDAIAGQRAMQIEGDRRAAVLPVRVRYAAELIGAVKAAGGGSGPWQVQWGLTAMLMDDAEAGRLAASYAQRLPAGSEIVINVPGGPEGIRFAQLTGAFRHRERDLERWCGEAGLDLAAPVADVLAWGREKLAEGLRGDAGRIVAAVARKPTPTPSPGAGPRVPCPRTPLRP